MVRTCRLPVATLFLVSVFTAGSFAATKEPAITITLTPSINSPQFLGTSISWTATVHNGLNGHVYDYRFDVSLQSQDQIVRDFDRHNKLVWVPYTVEGTYQVTVTVRDVTTPLYIVYPPVSVQYVLLPWVTAPGGAAVHPTSHPLVALFSGPPVNRAIPCWCGFSKAVRIRQVQPMPCRVRRTVPTSTSRECCLRRNTRCIGKKSAPISSTKDRI